MMPTKYIVLLLLAGWGLFSPQIVLSQDNTTEPIEGKTPFFNDTEEESKYYKRELLKEKEWNQNPDQSYLQEDLQSRNRAKNTWKKNRDKLHYAQKLKPEEEKKKEETESTDETNSFTAEGWGPYIRWILIGLGVLLLVGFIYFLARGGSFRQGKKIHVDISEKKIDWIEENLPEADVKSPLEAAINSGQYRKAIRLYFLLIVQRLGQSGEIKWQKEKTNRAYILETYNKNFHDDFRSCVRVYERVWYGERDVNEDEFWKIEPTFKQLAAQFTNLIETDETE